MRSTRPPRPRCKEAFAAFTHTDQRVAILCGKGERAVTDLPELWRCLPSVGIATDKPIVTPFPDGASAAAPSWR